MPVVSVIIPAYQAGKYISDSIQSILNQTYQDIEVIVIDDGSTDNTRDVLKKFSGKIKTLYQKNAGPAEARNRGIRESSGKYIAFLDADDIALPERIEKQLDYLKKHPEVGILGSACFNIDEEGCTLGYQKVSKNDLEIRWTFIFSNAFIQSTVILRRSLLIENHLHYDPSYHPVEDYELWKKLICFTKTSNLPQPLISYRIHNNSFGSIQHENQKKNLLRAAKRTLDEIKIPEDRFEDICKVINWGTTMYPSLTFSRSQVANDYVEIWDWFKKKYSGNKDINALQNDVINRAARIVLYPPFQKGWHKVLFRLMLMDILWPVKFLVSIPRVFINHQKLKKASSHRYL